LPFLLPVKSLCHNIVTDVSGIPDLHINLALFLAAQSLGAAADALFLLRDFHAVVESLASFYCFVPFVVFCRVELLVPGLFYGFFPVSDGQLFKRKFLSDNLLRFYKGEIAENFTVF
jgi:hypothetical protein